MTIKTYPKMNKDIVRILRVGGTPSDLYAAQRIGELEEHLMTCETERDWVQTNEKLIIDACKAAGWKRDRNHPTLGDDIAAFVASRKTENTLLKARVGELEEALKAISNAELVENIEFDTVAMAIFAEEALASTGIEALKEQLAVVDRESGVLGQVEWGGNSTMKTCCPDCATEAIDHTETCELSAWIERLKIKRDRLNQALEELG